MLDVDDIKIVQSKRKTGRYAGEINIRKMFRCTCDCCGKDRGYQTKSRYKTKPFCVKCATNTENHKQNLKQKHWSKTGSFSPRTELTLEQREALRQKYLAWNRDFYKKYYQKNKIDIHQKRKNRLDTNINVKLAASLRTRLRNAVVGDAKAGSAVSDLGCSIENLKQYLESKWQQGMSWDNWTRTGWHIDHVVPLISFDLSDREQLLKACHYTNLQPLWSKDNLIKGRKQ